MAQLRVDSKLDSTGFEAGINKMSRSVTSFGTKLSRIAGGFGIAFGGAALVGMARRVTKLGSDLSDLAVQSGLTIEQFQVLEFALRQAGVSPDKLRGAMSRLNVVMGQAKRGMKTYVDLLNLVGISQDQLSTMSPADALERIAQTMNTAERGSAEFGAALEILGTRSGAQLVEALQKLATDGFDKLAQEAKKAGAIMDDAFIKELDKIEDKLQETERRLTFSFGKFFLNVRDVAETNAAFLGTLFAALTDEAIDVGEAMTGFLQDIEDKEEPRETKKGGKVGPLEITPPDPAIVSAMKELAREKDALITKQLSTEQKLAKLEERKALLYKERIRLDAESGADTTLKLRMQAEILRTESKIIDLKGQKAREEKREAKDAERTAKTLADIERQKQEAIAGAGVSSATSIANEIQRIGGVLGGFMNPETKLAERNLAIQKDIAKLNEKRNDLLAEIASKDNVARVG